MFSPMAFAADPGARPAPRVSPEAMLAEIDTASAFLKALAHEGRMTILCHLGAGEKSVTELETLLGARQAAVSQQLARLRQDGIVSARREGRAIYYTIADARARDMVLLLQRLFCG